LDSSIVKYGCFFHFGTFEPYEQEKMSKILSWNFFKISALAEIGIFSDFSFLFSFFCPCFPSKPANLIMLVVPLKIQEICSRMDTRTSKIDREISEFWDNWILNPKLPTLEIQSAEIEPFWATPNIFFLRMRFFTFFLAHMAQKYQNE